MPTGWRGASIRRSCHLRRRLRRRRAIRRSARRARSTRCASAPGWTRRVQPVRDRRAACRYRPYGARAAAGEGARRGAAARLGVCQQLRQGHRPRALCLPSGRGPQFCGAIAELIRDLGAALPAAFESQDYQARRRSIDEAFRRKQEQAFSALTKEAGEKNVAIVRTPFGFGVAPLAEGGEVLKPEAFGALPEASATGCTNCCGSSRPGCRRSCRPCRAGTRSDAKRRARSTATPRASPSATRSTRPRRTSPTCRWRSSTSTRCATTCSTTSGVHRPGAGGGARRERRRGAGVGEHRPLERYEVNVLVTAKAPPARRCRGTAPDAAQPGRPRRARLAQGRAVDDFRRLKAGALHGPTAATC